MSTREQLDWVRAAYDRLSPAYRAVVTTQLANDLAKQEAKRIGTEILSQATSALALDPGSFASIEDLRNDLSPRAVVSFLQSVERVLKAALYEEEHGA